jgi:hypothetical protein
MRAEQVTIDDESDGELSEFRERATLPAPALPEPGALHALRNMQVPDNSADVTGKPTDPVELAEWSTLLNLYRRATPTERKVLLAIATRIDAGRTVYGPMKRRGRSWIGEALAEVLDLAVYLTAEEVGVE